MKRWRRNMDVSDDTRYPQTLTTLSEASVRRSFSPYTDIYWDADEYLGKRVPHMLPISCLDVPVIMRVLCQAIVALRSFFKAFDIPRSARKELFFDAPESRQTLRHVFVDVRMLCHELGLMNSVALLMWRICRIGGRPSRYRGEPQREHLPASFTRH